MKVKNIKNKLFISITICLCIYLIDIIKKDLSKDQNFKPKITNPQKTEDELEAFEKLFEIKNDTI